MRTAIFVLLLFVGYDGVFNSFKGIENAYRFVDGMFASVTEAM